MTRALKFVKLFYIGGLVAEALAKAAGKQTSNFLVPFILRRKEIESKESNDSKERLT